MKLLLSTLTIFTTVNLLANTTMCFKENHDSLSTIEDIKLDGGECKSLYTLKDMKEKGWNVKDIKITPKNDKYSFIYILNKKEVKIVDKNLEENIIKKIEAKKELENKKNLDKENEKDIEDGRKIYTSKCVVCHGQKGEIEAYNSSEALNTLSYDDMNFAIRRYTFDSSYGNGSELVMQPYAKGINSEDLRKVHKYLESINK